MLIFKNRSQVSKQQLTNISKECQKWTRLKSQEGKNTNVWCDQCVMTFVWRSLFDHWLHCVMCDDHCTVSQPSVDHCTEVRFASLLSSGFTIMAVLNPPETELANHTSVHCVMTTLSQIKWWPLFDDHCVTTKVTIRPICHNQFVTTTVLQSLCDNHCVTTTVWQDCFALNYRNMTFLTKRLQQTRRKWWAYE